MPYRTSKETQLRKDARKEHIISSAAVLFEKNGYSRTTIKDIVNAADISTGTYYFYFKNKEELFETLYNRFIKIHENISNYSLQNADGLVRGFSRSKTAELWLFQHCRGLARAMIIEAVGLNPVFERKREEIYRKSHERIEKLFKNLDSAGVLRTSSPWINTLLCNGTLYSVIDDWLQSDGTSSLMEFAYPIIAFNLNAFKISFDEAEVENYISGMTAELDQHYEEIKDKSFDMEE